MYSPSRAQAVKTSLPANSQSVQQILKSMSTPITQGKKVGASTVAGMKCNAYKITKGKNSAAIDYQSTDPRFPLPLKTVITVGRAKQTTQTKTIKLNNTIASRMFTLPAGVKVKEAKMPSQPQAGSAAPKQ
jgi:ABC-type hemin transport system ATPase subunit